MEGMDEVRDKRKGFHTRTQEKVPEVCGKDVVATIEKN